MRITRKSAPSNLGVVLVMAAFLTFACTSCNTRQQGCLDPFASNFDLDGEKSCDGCCSYPALTLTLTQKLDEQNLSLPDTLTDVHQQPFILRDIQLLLSTFSWTDASQEMYAVDTATYACTDELLRYTPDEVIIQPIKFVYTLGTIRTTPVMDSLFVHLGVTEDISCIDSTASNAPEFYRVGSPLRDPETKQLHALRLIISADLNVPDQTDTLFIDGSAILSLGYPFTFRRGTAETFRLTLNYLPWFTTADLLDLSTFSTSFQEGFAGSLTVTP